MTKELLMTDGLEFVGEFNGENDGEFSGQEWEDESSPRRQRSRRSTRSRAGTRGQARRRPRPVHVRGASEYVRWLQSALNQIMGLHLPLDGLMGIATRSALRSFQKQQGLPMNGIVGPDTERALLAARGGQPPAKRASQPSEPEPPVESPSQPSDSEPPDENSGQSSDPELPETEYTQFSVEPFAFVRELAEQENIESVGQEWEDESSRVQSRPRRSTRPQPGGRERRRIRPRAVPARGGSEYVRWVQSALNQIMDLRLPLDGVLGAATRSALRRFQQREGLPVDGIVGPDTEQALLAARGGQAPTKRASQPSEPEPPETEVAEQAWEGWVGEVGSNYGSAPSYIPITTSDSLTPVPGIENTSQAFKLKVIRIAQSLDTDPNFLMAIMSFESNGFNPQARNPHSGATGLIQFMPKTATNLGTTTDALARMTAEQQLDYVAKYFAPYKGRLKTLDDAYMAVLWPPAIGQGSNYVLFSSPSTAYQQNQPLDVNKDGKVTVAEATSFVRKKLGSTAPVPIGSPTSPAGGPVNRSSPEYIRWVQQALNKLMGVQLAVDGISGPMTRSAVRSFQQKHGLLVDGIVGPQTEGALIAAGAGNPPGSAPSYMPPSAPAQPPTNGSSRAQLAQQILTTSRISLWPYSPIRSTSSDGADALSNIRDTAAGKAARRSNYDNAPGGTVYLDLRLLAGILQLANTYTIRVTAIAGGSHDPNSRHYVGIAFDVDTINEVRVNSSNSYYTAFMQKCRDLGATEILGPGDKGHDTHVHCAWPRP